MTQTRVPKGSPKGGQFDAGRAPVGPDLRFEDIFKKTKRWANFYGFKYRVDADDIAQEAMLTYSSAVKDPDREMTDAAIANSVKWAAIAALKTRGNHRDDGAIKVYHQACYDEMNRLGRLLTSDEEDVIAANIRASVTKDPPTHGFHRRSMEIQLGVGVGKGAGYGNDHDTDRLGYLVESRAASAENTPEYNFDDDELIESALVVASASPVEARPLAWASIAPDAPHPATGTVSKRRATAARKQVKADGGAVASARNFQKGLLDSESLFLPFGTLNDDEKESICHVLTKYPNYGENLWATAMSMAEDRT